MPTRQWCMYISWCFNVWTHSIEQKKHTLFHKNEKPPSRRVDAQLTAYLHFQDSEKSTCTIIVFSLNVSINSLHACASLWTRHTCCCLTSKFILIQMKQLWKTPTMQVEFHVEVDPTGCLVLNSLPHWFHLSLEPELYAWFCTINRCKEGRPHLLECNKLIKNYPPVWVTLKHPQNLKPGPAFAIGELGSRLGRHEEGGAKYWSASIN